ncbi:MAG TPA: TRAP transporter large permease [Syntrophales bacterium]|nr:TRAP transporter large permease [Syntrophales bacterium]
MDWILLIGVVITFALFLTGSPIFVALGIGSAFLTQFAFGMPPHTCAHMVVQGISSFTMLALPLFVYMGEIFLEGGAAKALFDVMKVTFGRIPGGLGIATVVAAGFFAAICGSAAASIATIGIIMIPQMLEENYDEGFAGSVVSVSGTLGNIIPPSMFFIIYGALVEQNVATLFAAGMLPGILTVGIMVVCAYIIGKRKGYILSAEISPHERRDIIKRSVPALIMPVIVLGSIYAGIATPTEAASVACVYSLIIGVFFYRGLNWQTFWNATKRAANTIGSVMIMVAGGILLGRMFVLAEFPQKILNLVMTASLSPLAFLLLASIVIIILGTFMECILMLFVCVPLFYASVMALGISPIHFGVVLVVGIMVGQNTPPMAESIFIASAVGNIPAAAITKSILPFVLCIALVFYLTIFFPELSLIIPRSLGLVLP